MGYINNIRDSFHVLLEDTIPKVIREAGTSSGIYDISFQPLSVGNSVVIHGQDGTDYYSIKAMCTVKNTRSGENVSFTAELLKLPCLQELGFKVRGNYMQQLDIYERARGMSFLLNKDGTCSAKLLSDNNRSIQFIMEKKIGPVVKLLLRGDKKKKIPVSVFFRALCGCSDEDLISTFGFSNPYIVQAFGSGWRAQNIYDCILDVGTAIMGDSAKNQTTTHLKKEIMRSIFNERNFYLGKGSMQEMDYQQSFSYRANGKKLACEIKCNGYVFQSGTVLTNEELTILDSLPISVLKVNYRDKIYALRKFSYFRFPVLGCRLASPVEVCGVKINAGIPLSIEQVTLLNQSELATLTLAGGKTVTRRVNVTGITKDDLFQVFSIWMDNVNGYGLYTKEFELTNRILIPFDKKVDGLIRDHLNCIIQNLLDGLLYLDESESIVGSFNNVYDGVKPEAFILSIVDPKNSSGQMADMCNVLAYSAKSMKAVIPQGVEGGGDSLVAVQDLENGRFDPLDIPESDKIGKVHYRTILSKTDDSGNLTAPYIRVDNGIVVSNIPAYLTATEEADNYIAQWDETFHNEDGSLKDRVVTRCNGSIQSVDISRVMYKEYSPFQGLSATHAMVPFPGHSNGKRITMACNQGKQAVPTVNTQRPFSGSGGESILGIGVITAKDVLKQFYDENMDLIKEDKETVMGSKIELVGVMTKGNIRALTYKVLAVGSSANSTTIELPYLLKSPEATMFSYNINAVNGNIYGCNDIVAYNNGYSLKKYPVEMCADFGSQTVDESVFNSGIALVQNLNVVYKTFASSVIEDGIVISDRLIYDDSLTHVALYEIKTEIRKDKDVTEVFGIGGSDAPSYFMSNGLPKEGTYLKPGMPAICRIITSRSKITKKYTFVGTYVEGQVVSAEISRGMYGLAATVILASRESIQTGDKLAGRCGNKGIVAKIVPAAEMPYRKDTGEVADIVLNPLGIPSRQNITQLFEAALNYCMKLEGKIAVVTPYHSGDVDFVKGLMEKDGVHPFIMVDGRTGEEFERPMNFGNLPIQKLHHVSKRKIHAVGMDANLDPTFLQPAAGAKRNGGQTFGEMESWCVEAAGATLLLNEFQTVLSDDIAGRNNVMMQQTCNKEVHTCGENCNDMALLAYYRSLGIDIISNPDEQSYDFAPLRDKVIRSYSPKPIKQKSQLQADAFFYKNDTVESKAKGRGYWSWIDLHCEIVLPLWIVKNGLAPVFGCSMRDLRGLIDYETFLDYQYVGSAVIYKADEIPDECVEHCHTGIGALVWLFKNFDVYRRRDFLYNAMLQAKENNGIDSNKYRNLVKSYKAVQDFINSGYQLKDYVVSSYPVMPRTYRPNVNIGGRETTPDFDYFYGLLLQIASRIANRDVDATEEEKRELWNCILSFTGITEKKEGKNKTLSSFFCGKNSKGRHGSIRENIQSKRVMCSFRAAIKPAEDFTRKPTEIGIPLTILVKIFAEPLYGHFRALSISGNVNKRDFGKAMMYLALRDSDRFRSFYEDRLARYFTFDGDVYQKMTDEVRRFMAGSDGLQQRVAVVGRQPSLHKYSIRAFTIYPVYENVVNLHPLLCTGFNADFDGDQMYGIAIVSVEAAEEALEKLSPAKDYILSKDGSVVLKHTQDIVLGVYCGTMLRNNALSVGNEDFHYYDSINAIWADFYNNDLNLWDIVVYTRKQKRYISTAGRVMFNAIIPGAFTDKPFTNSAGIAGINNSFYNELEYDGIVGSGSGGGVIRYFRLADIVKHVSEKYPERNIDVLQAITEYGFIVSDKVGVSLSLQDIDIRSDREALLAEGDRLKRLIEQDYQDGLISDQDRVASIIDVYNNDKTGINKRITDSILENLDRNNNIFIMMDSGARGNKSQLMHMCGALGVLQKTKTEDLEAPITKNYYNGLNSFDVHLASYSARIGVASTQNETKSSGYATHKVVYMASGLEIVEEDCGNRNAIFRVEWGDLKPSSVRFMPSKRWFDKNLKGLKLVDGDVLDDRYYTRLKNENGFHTIFVEELNGRQRQFIADPYDAVGSTLQDKESKKLLAKMCGKKLDIKGIDSLVAHKVGEFETEDGTYLLRYSMSDSCRSLLTNRVGYELPSLTVHKDITFGKEITVFNEEAKDFIEEQKLDFVKARTTMTCRSKYGICAHCYGLMFSNNQLPPVGSFVGTESAQSIAEPASQLTLNVINKGGVSGATNVSSGVKVFDTLLAGGEIKEDMLGGMVADTSGYICLNKTGKKVRLGIMPESTDSDKCIQCMQKHKCIVCPVTHSIGADGDCFLDTKLGADEILLRNGEWIDAGSSITKGLVHPDSIQNVAGIDTEEGLHVVKQRVWINNYYNTFKMSGLSIYARHFEMLAYLQNKYVKVLSSDDPDILPGSVIEFNEATRNLDKITICQMVSKRDDVILRNSGALTSLAFENVVEIANKLVSSGHKSSITHNHSLIGSLSIGENLATREMKLISRPENILIDEKIENEEEKPHSFDAAEFVVQKKVVENDSIDLPEELLSINIEDFFSEEPEMEEIPKEPVKEAKKKTEKKLQAASAF